MGEHGPTPPSGPFSLEDLVGHLTSLEKRFAPSEVYIAGRREFLSLEPRVSIVGARKASEAGRNRAHKLAKELAGQGVVIVSGLAAGIDTAAHHGALDAAGGRTIAVIGTPLNRSYPRENAALQERLSREQLVLSQFRQGTRTERHHFVMRNRVMALISEATVIVEASDTSGSLSQGREAIRLGRLLFMLKSVLDAPGLAWPRALEQRGARVLERTEDLLQELVPPGEALGYADVAF